MSQEAMDVDDKEETEEGDAHSVTENEAALLSLTNGWPIVRATAANFLSGQTFSPWKGQPLVSSTPCS